MIICGVLVQAHPDSLNQVLEQLAERKGVEIHHTTDDGRIVITVEGGLDDGVDETLLELHRMNGVLSASLTYHYFESDEIAGEQNHETFTA
ncbi:MAG: chaperone NapD [Alphaproteobacteria bacterium]|nr:chaperone NapD [Alphaproteobacteria bacterium]